MATITFTKVGSRVTVDNNGIKIGYQGQMNVFEHPTLEAVVVSSQSKVTLALNGEANGDTFLVESITAPVATNKSAMVVALQSIFS